MITRIYLFTISYQSSGSLGSWEAGTLQKGDFSGTAGTAGSLAR